MNHHEVDRHNHLRKRLHEIRCRILTAAAYKYGAHALRDYDFRGDFAMDDEFRAVYSEIERIICTPFRMDRYFEKAQKKRKRYIRIADRV